jgi:lipid-binding SYLF domain-containing protein
MTMSARLAAMVALSIAWLAGCSTAPPTPEAKEALSRSAASERQEWNRLDPNFETFVRQSHGFALFPQVTKGGAGIGGAYGRGVVYEGGQHVGYADITQGSVGLQLGGQTYSELIVFENKSALERFKQNRMDFGANATAVIARTGTAANLRFVDGVAVFVRPTAGAMAEASIDGQRITYVPR